jgi:hypothetical protein
MKKTNNWRLLAKALGEKASKCDNEADKIALIRLLMFLSILITNCFIVANAIRHWNDETKIEVFVETSSSPEYQTPSMKVSNRTLEFK